MSFPPPRESRFGLNDIQAYMIPGSCTKALFLHMTISESPSPFWGNILKSNSNGACFTLAIDNVNRNDIGYADFEEMMGLNGIALVNIASNPEEARVTNED